MDWLAGRRRPVIAVVAVLVVTALAVLLYRDYQRRRDAAASQILSEAREAARSGNLPLAASDLSRLLDSYPGTVAAGEGVILLAQVRLIQEQPEQAADDLRRALQGSIDDQFRAPAYAMLATALEQARDLAGAAQAYRSAADAAWYQYLTAQYLVDAGRAYAEAGDTARAIEAYETVIQRHEDAPGAVEARVRLAELKAASGAALGG